MDRVEQIQRVQKHIINFYDRTLPEESSLDHVLLACAPLERLMDAEVRHVTLSSNGLAETLTRIFIECMCALRGRDDMPVDDYGVRARICQVFAEKNRFYHDTFSDFGAVGIVIRLLDHVHALRDGNARSLIHIANYVCMTVVVLWDADKDFFHES